MIYLVLKDGVFFFEVALVIYPFLTEILIGFLAGDSFDLFRCAEPRDFLPGLLKPLMIIFNANYKHSATLAIF
jgi:hypothetical protein